MPWLFNPLTGKFDYYWQGDLDDLANVNIAGLANQDLIWWNAVAGEWQNVLPGTMAGAIDFDDLADVDTIGVVGDDILFWHVPALEWRIRSLANHLTTIMLARGDILRMGAAIAERYALGAAGTYLRAGALDPAWAIPAFLELGDTPAAYAGNALMGLRVNAGANALEFVNRGWEKVVDWVAPANATSVTFAGLDLDAAEVYDLFFSVENAGAAGSDYYIYFNNDMVNANYWFQYITANGGVLAAGRLNLPNIGFVFVGHSSIANVFISRPPDGRPRWAMRVQSRRTGATIQMGFYSGCWNTIANVTRIDIVASVVNGIGAGSRVIINRVAGP